MRAITVRQPWAALIMHGGKNVENRSRNIVGDYRGPVAIHAALTYDNVAMHTVGRLADHPAARTAGAIIGVVDVIGVHRAGECPGGDRGRCDPWGEDFDGVHIELAWPRPFTEPIPCRGFLGLWTVPPMAAVNAGAALIEAVRR